MEGVGVFLIVFVQPFIDCHKRKSSFNVKKFAVNIFSDQFSFNFIYEIPSFAGDVTGGDSEILLFPSGPSGSGHWSVGGRTAASGDRPL